ncbi:MAG: DMT family transporter [Solirubrobacteraceae bacterium]
MKNRSAILALSVAGILWGLTVALSKLSLRWLDPSWLAVLRFAVASPLMAYIGRRGLREALAPGVFAAGALGFGAVLLLQNIGIAHTSVSHAAILVGALPVVVALISVGARDGTAPPLAWVGYGVALVGVVLVAKGGGGGATVSGDMLVLGSVLLAALFIAMQPRVLRGRNVASVTAVEFASGATVALPVALLTGLPHAPASPGPVLVFLALALPGTILPFWLFAYGQARVSAALAGVFVNLEPLVGGVVGWVAFSDPFGVWQLLGAVAVIGGVALSLVPGGWPTRMVLARRQHGVGRILAARNRP